MHFTSLSGLFLMTLCIIVQVVPNTATFETLAITAGGVVTTFTAAQVAGILGVGLLTKASGLATGVLLGRLIARSQRSRGRRAVLELEYLDNNNITNIDNTLELMLNLEPEDCYKRVLCAVGTGG